MPWSVWGFEVTSLKRYPQFEVVGEAGSAAAKAIEQVTGHSIPRSFIMDIRLPGASGIESL